MKDLIFISAQPADYQFLWQLAIQLNNFRELGISDRYHVLLYTGKDRRLNPEFLDLNKLFPEAKFYYYNDETGQCGNYINVFNYIPMLRPWCLKKHFERFPDLVNKAIFYLDSDVVFTKSVEWLDKLKDDDVCYLSDTKGYMSASYFDRMIGRVNPQKINSYKARDILQECASHLGISRQICEENENNTGGAQYLLKNIDGKFWEDVMNGCMILLTHLRAVNEKFFPGDTPKEREDAGFQVWCSDMWAVVWNLWKRKMVTSTPDEMRFAWSGEHIDNWTTYNIYHDAGPCPECFNKGRYRDNLHSPFEEQEQDHLKGVPFNTCSFNYVKEILKTKDNFNF